MSFDSLINLHNCRVTRKTDIILIQTQITASPIIDRQPSEASCLQIKISGCSDGTGIVVINGTVNGVADSETLSFSQNDILQGEKEFTNISSISTLGFIDEATVGTIEIRAITPSGQAIDNVIEIFAAMSCWVDVRRGGVQIIIPGGIVTSVTKLFCKHNPLHPLLENDIIEYNGRIYRVDSIEPCNSRAKSPHHLELILKRAKIEES